jgi:CRISPR type I-A-associated protein Csa5
MSISKESQTTIHKKVANALAAYTLATRSYTVLDRLANAISADAVIKAIYELNRSLDVIIRNSKEDQAISYNEKERKIIITSRWGNDTRKFTIKGNLPNEYEYQSFLEKASKDIMVARSTAAYASSIIASKVSSNQMPREEMGSQVEQDQE